MYHIYGDDKFEKLSHISKSHIYNLRKTKIYTSRVLFYTKTKKTAIAIGERRKPDNQGKPGFLRVDSVHQGDLDKEKGVYYINIVDEISQWEFVGCVETISEQHLIPVLEELLELLPFKIINFHSDNGSEDIIDEKGKIKKEYKEYLTPCQKLLTIKNMEEHLVAGVTRELLETELKK